jgi:homoserine dehydrogenase
MAPEDRAFRVGLLGHGTVGSAFAALLEERAGEVEAITGLRPRLSGVLTRSRGDFDEIVRDSDLVVEVIGGLDPARDYVLRAMRAGRHVVTANKQLLSQHGEELWAAARESGVQLRFEAAVAGVVPVIRVL